MLVGQPHRLAMAAGQSLSFAAFAPAIDWTDGVNDVLCRQPAACRDDCFYQQSRLPILATI